MSRPLVIILFINLFFLQSTYAQFHISEKKINKNKIAKQIKNYVEKNYEGSSVKYYEVKTGKDSIFYEAKVKLNEGSINLIFNGNYQYVGVDSEVHYLDISEEIRNLINSSLNKQFPTYKITHCRDQKNGTQDIYELDVTANKKRYKFQFKNDGTLIDFKEVPEKAIDLIFN